MPKILIICDVYPPSFAPRMAYLVKYIKELGWSAEIVTRGQDSDLSFQSLLGDEKITRIKGVSIPMKTTKDKVIRLITQKQTHKKNANLISNRIIKDLNPNDYGLILCSTAHRTFILEAANQVAKDWNKPWLADIRDLNEQKPKVNQLHKVTGNFVFKYFNRNYKKFLLKNRNLGFKSANEIVTITPWHVEQIKKYNKNTHLIYNGFCPEMFYPRLISKQKIFKITYTGLIVSKEYRDPTLLFKAVNRLSENGIIDKGCFRIQFYTPANKRSPILENSEYKKIKDFVDFYEYVDTSEIPMVLHESAILLLLTNVFKTDGPKGIMTTKYFEYLAMERPILCVRSDENILEDSINESNAGVAARNVDEVYDFLLKKWKEWEDKGYTTIEANREYTQQFSRKLQAKQFVDLFEKVINI